MQANYVMLDFFVFMLMNYFIFAIEFDPEADRAEMKAKKAREKYNRQRSKPVEDCGFDSVTNKEQALINKERKKKLNTIDELKS